MPTNKTKEQLALIPLVEATDVTSLIIHSLTCPFTVLLNVLVIMAVKRRPRLQTNSNILLACLAVADVLTGLITQPASILWKTFKLTGVINYTAPTRMIHAIAMRVLSVCSCLHLMLVTGERLVAIKFTNQYPYIVTKENIKVAVISCWIVCLASEVCKVFKHTEIISFISIVVVLCSCIVFVVSAYAVLYLETRRHRKLIKTQQMPQEEAERFLKENKALKTTVYVVVALVLCFAPMVISMFFSKITKRKESAIIFQWFRTFAILNSLLNPIIYCWRQEEMRKFILKKKTQVAHPVM